LGGEKFGCDFGGDGFGSYFVPGGWCHVDTRVEFGEVAVALGVVEMEVVGEGVWGGGGRIEGYPWGRRVAH